ncbi:E3 ubiquitin/ISG15 ligase TRIM25-like isoform X2 [Sardina pilchardus]|uniref:E3 ubiquitin/ISG15 ligase TRIM25-like isoform X2 n=1 Tax=Sardina pilchardus TaxID=27697 RepID=UPI002E144AE3
MATSCNQDLFTCSICLDILKDPVTITCGHNYCMGCIKGCWDREDHEVYSCPQCRQTFTPRPVLHKNNIVAELVEQYRQRNLATSTAQCSAGPEDVECDVCTGRKLKALKSCLDCLLSYCDTHFKLHNDVNPGRKHNVIDAICQLQKRICTQHEKPVEIFCRKDQCCVCLLCLVNEHKGHDTVSAATGRSEKQKQLGKTQRKFQQIIQEKEKELQKLKRAVATLKSSTQKAVEYSERTFTEIIRSIERRRSEVTELIRAQEKAEVSRAEVLLKPLEQEITELKRRDAEMEQLSHTEDHIHFLMNFQSVSTPLQSEDLPSITINQSFSFEAVKKCVSTLKGQLDDFCKQEVMKIAATVSDIQAVFAEPTTREECIQLPEVQSACAEAVIREEFLQLEKHVHLCENNTRVEWRGTPGWNTSIPYYPYPYHRERFWWCYQVLCKEEVSGRCYWEVEWSGENVYIAISYKSIDRNGCFESWFGRNAQSWCLDLSSSSSSFWHDDEETKLPLVTSSRIGVYVDQSEGVLAFYSISDTMTLLHRVQTTFTEALYPGFYNYIESSLKIL